MTVAAFHDNLTESKTHSKFYAFFSFLPIDLSTFLPDKFSLFFFYFNVEPLNLRLSFIKITLALLVL